MTAFELNGVSVETDISHPHLLSAIRDEFGLISPKDGCSPSGQCGCCTVLIDGKARIACQTPMEKVSGSKVFTLEGFDPKERELYSQTFAAHGALQCGFCIPGILVRTKALIDRKGDSLTREEASRHLGAHLCRCTGYTKILDAVEALASEETPVRIESGGVGSSGVRYEAEALSLGDRKFIDDIPAEGLLHGAVRLSDHARAKVLKIDIEKAEKCEGVEKIITASDVPGELKVGLIHQDWPVFLPEGGQTSYLGDVIALVVAKDRDTARKAAQLIDVEYKVLKPFSNPIDAINSDEDAVWELDGNVLSESSYARGDVRKALQESKHLVEEIFQTQRVEQAFLEPESTLAVPKDGGLYVYSGGQGVWDDRNQIAKVLGVETTAVTVELVSNGGAFGGKEDLSNQAQTALAAHLLGQPVRCTLSREESLLMHAKRHPIQIIVKAGCDENGLLSGLWVRMIGDSGPYASVGMKVLERAAGHASGPYVVPAIDVRSVAVRTNNPVGGAFRGFGANQAQFAMEGVMDRLAEKVGISGWEIRNRNVIKPGSIWGPGQIMDEGSSGAQACLEAIKKTYDQAIKDGKAVGLGLGLKNSGLGNGAKEVAKAVVRFRKDGKVEVRHCWTEMGQGVHTVALQVAVEELGVDASEIEVIVDTSREMNVGQTTGSRGTLMGAGSVADACRVALEDGCKPEIDYEGEYRVDWTNAMSDDVENPIIHSTFGYAAQLVMMDEEQGKINHVVAAHDVGRAVNPVLCEGQIEGAVHMGLGYALSEGFPTDDDAKPTNMTLKSLGILRPKDMPTVEVILVEEPQPDSPYGIKGVGEIGLVPTAGAVATALRAQDGIWRNSLPMSLETQQENWQEWNHGD